MSLLDDSKLYRQKLEKLWASHKVHQSWISGESMFPWTLKLQRISDRQLIHELDQVRYWRESLERQFRSEGVELVYREYNFAAMGRQRLPVHVCVNSAEAMAALLGKTREWRQFTRLCTLVRERLPDLGAWLVANPSQVMANALIWDELIAVCQYFIRRPKPGLYLRELDIPGVDSKFVEKHRKILKTLLDHLLPAEQINSDFTRLSENGFEKRFGLRYPEPRIRLRLLDPNMHADFGGLSDLEVPLDQFARLDLLCDRVFITENLLNGLVFPPMKNAVVLFGLGYGIQALKNVQWLQNCRLYYWGDIDSHGFAILSQARGYFPRLDSFLMDEQTLVASKPFWGSEPAGKSCPKAELPGLSNAEQALYRKLKQDIWQPNLRLEQERIPYSIWQQSLINLDRTVG